MLIFRIFNYNAESEAKVHKKDKKVNFHSTQSVSPAPPASKYSDRPRKWSLPQNIHMKTKSNHVCLALCGTDIVLNHIGKLKAIVTFGIHRFEDDTEDESQNA